MMFRRYIVTTEEYENDIYFKIFENAIEKAKQIHKETGKKMRVLEIDDCNNVVDEHLIG